ncbi:hypothetical protein NQ318_007326 [Aromia moschata]|uniref:RNase H type-1 domain-containing protein n=1 Tax=Aromia moschata TaxID=1265417 RepID=A0AAV8YZE8_9CUCU|nr:hypothetical protein NQ318_007326 [Aromia moschata]
MEFANISPTNISPEDQRNANRSTWWSPKGIYLTKKLTVATVTFLRSDCLRSDCLALLSLLVTNMDTDKQCAMINNHRTCTNKINIITDSHAPLGAVCSCKVTSRLVLECQEALKELADRTTWRLVWVPSHDGIPGNEHADQWVPIQIIRNTGAILQN